MIQIIIGITIGIILTILITLLVKYLDHKGLKLDWSRIFILIVIIYLIYSFIGIIVSPLYKRNGNVCKGFNYGIQICGGDINAE